MADFRRRRLLAMLPAYEREQINVHVVRASGSSARVVEGVVVGYCQSLPYGLLIRVRQADDMADEGERPQVGYHRIEVVFVDELNIRHLVPRGLKAPDVRVRRVRHPGSEVLGHLQGEREGVVMELDLPASTILVRIEENGRGEVSWPMRECISLPPAHPTAAARAAFTTGTPVAKTLHFSDDS